LDEVFGADCCVGEIAWQKRTSRENRAVLSPSIDHLLVYSKSLPDTWKLYRNLLLPGESGYSNPDKDPKGEWASIPFSAQGFRENQVYTITTPTGLKLQPPKERCWGATEPEFEKLKKEGRVYWPKGGDGRPRIKQYPEDAKGLVPSTLWLSSEVGDTEESKKQLLEIFSDRQTLNFHAPKPPTLIQRILEIATKPDSIVLDSFAGTGSTAHAVLAKNSRDSDNRRFILVEMEDYADDLTAERVRRVINGYEFKGTQKTELLRERLNWRTLTKAADLVHKVEGIENLERGRFDRIKREISDNELIVTGEKTVTERTEGLGGTFTYCTLGKPVELDRVLNGDALPAFAALGAALFHMATNRAFDPAGMDEGDFYLGETESHHVWLIYRDQLDWLKSPDAALTLARAKGFAAAKPGKKHLVFAPSCFVSQKLLAEQNIPVEFVPLPFALYRIERT
jgi:adenine-specific DNA-methyltransferase